MKIDANVLLCFEIDTNAFDFDKKSVGSKEDLVKEALRQTLENILISHFKDDESINLVFSHVEPKCLAARELEDGS